MNSTPSPDKPSGAPGQQHRQALELLERFHQFPTLYTFKVIGFNHHDLAGRVRAAACRVLDGESPPDPLPARPSRGGRYLAVSLEAEVADAETVLRVYAALREVEGVVSLF